MSRAIALTLLVVALLALLAACARMALPGGVSGAAPGARAPDALRIATYNTSLYSDQAGGLV